METTTDKQTKWVTDPVHSEVEFKAKHLVISTVTGRFQQFEAEAIANKDDFTDVQVTFTADAKSITTNNDQRDTHLRSDDFFNTDKYPEITFKSREFKKVGDDTYKLIGDLTIRDVTKPVELDVEYGGIATDPYGNTKAGFEVTGKVNRKEFGLKWNGMTEAGGIVVGDEIKIIANVQFIRQQ